MLWKKNRAIIDIDSVLSGGAILCSLSRSYQNWIKCGILLLLLYICIRSINRQPPIAETTSIWKEEGPWTRHNWLNLNFLYILSVSWLRLKSLVSSKKKLWWWWWSNAKVMLLASRRIFIQLLLLLLFPLNLRWMTEKWRNLMQPQSVDCGFQFFSWMSMQS